MADILHQTTIKASPETVFAALTKAEGIKAWWSEYTVAEPSVGFVNEVSFYGNMVTFKLRNNELTAGQKVHWAVEGGPHDWADTNITWTLSAQDGQTGLHFAHTGMASTEGNFAGANYTWGWYITSLKFYLEKGEGMPHTDADMM